MENKLINIGIQVVPLDEPDRSFPIIDECIATIAQSGLRHEVGAMETVVEGTFDELQLLVAALHRLLSIKPGLSFLLNLRYHIHNGRNVYMAEKTKKFR